jgi:uncharacterized protein YecT (DUF1311 family)
MPSQHTLKHFLLIAAVVLATGASDLTAQAPPPKPDCGNATTTAAMRSCAAARFSIAEQELRTVRTELLGKLDEQGKIKLLAAQNTWVQFRKANAEFQADLVRGGTLAPLVQITVMADMTEARVAELKKALKP